MNAVQPMFPSPYSVQPPKGAEDWRSIYPYYVQFQDNLREVEEKKFWFCNSQHWPTPFRPFDCIMVDFAIKCLGQYNTRHLLVPPANGIDYRILNGYVSFLPVAVGPADIEARTPQFLERAGHYYANWNDLLDNWKKKVQATIGELKGLTFEPLPEVVSIESVKAGVGLDNTTALFETYDKAIQLCYR